MTRTRLTEEIQRETDAKTIPAVLVPGERGRGASVRIGQVTLRPGVGGYLASLEGGEGSCSVKELGPKCQRQIQTWIQQAEARERTADLR